MEKENYRCKNFATLMEALGLVGEEYE